MAKKKLKKEIFAKLIELPLHQVLVTKDYDHDEESYLLVVASQVEGLGMSLKMGFNTEKDLNDAFDKYDEKMAVNSVKIFTDTIKG